MDDGSCYCEESRRQWRRPNVNVTFTKSQSSGEEELRQPPQFPSVAESPDRPSFHIPGRRLDFSNLSEEEPAYAVPQPRVRGTARRGRGVSRGGRQPGPVVGKSVTEIKDGRSKTKIETNWVEKPATAPGRGGLRHTTYGRIPRGASQPIRRRAPERQSSQPKVPIVTRKSITQINDGRSRTRIEEEWSERPVPVAGGLTFTKKPRGAGRPVTRGRGAIGTRRAVSGTNVPRTVVRKSVTEITQGGSKTKIEEKWVQTRGGSRAPISRGRLPRASAPPARGRRVPGYVPSGIVYSDKKAPPGPPPNSPQGSRLHAVHQLAGIPEPIDYSMSASMSATHGSPDDYPSLNLEQMSASMSATHGSPDDYPSLNLEQMSASMSATHGSPDDYPSLNFEQIPMSMIASKGSPDDYFLSSPDEDSPDELAGLPDEYFQADDADSPDELGGLPDEYFHDDQQYSSYEGSYMDTLPDTFTDFDPSLYSTPKAQQYSTYEGSYMDTLPDTFTDFDPSLYSTPKADQYATYQDEFIGSVPDDIAEFQPDINSTPKPINMDDIYAQIGPADLTGCSSVDKYFRTRRHSTSHESSTGGSGRVTGELDEVITSGAGPSSTSEGVQTGVDVLGHGTFTKDIGVPYKKYTKTETVISPAIGQKSVTKTEQVEAAPNETFDSSEYASPDGSGVVPSKYYPDFAETSDDDYLTPMNRPYLKKHKFRVSGNFPKRPKGLPHLPKNLFGDEVNIADSPEWEYDRPEEEASYQSRSHGVGFDSYVDSSPSMKSDNLEGLGVEGFEDTGRDPEQFKKTHGWFRPKGRARRKKSYKKIQEESKDGVYLVTEEEDEVLEPGQFDGNQRIYDLEGSDGLYSQRDSGRPREVYPCPCPQEQFGRKSTRGRSHIDDPRNMNQSRPKSSGQYYKRVETTHRDFNDSTPQLDFDASGWVESPFTRRTRYPVDISFGRNAFQPPGLDRFDDFDTSSMQYIPSPDEYWPHTPEQDRYKFLDKKQRRLFI